MKNIAYVLLVFLISCGREKTNENLFLDFPSGISKENFISLAKKNSSLAVDNESKNEYKYDLHLESTTIKASLKPIFQLNSDRLVEIFIHGETKNSSELHELENIFKEKYNTPEKIKDYTSIKNSQSNCSIWTLKSKTIKLCTDSFPDHGLEFVNSRIEKMTGEKANNSDQKKQIFCFEIHYTDKEIENQNLNEKTKGEL